MEQTATETETETPLIEIKSRFTLRVLFSLRATSMRLCLEAAVSGGADLRGADLGGADLGGADLRGADLRGADLTPIRDDLWAVLSAVPSEVAGLRQAIVDGGIDGSSYSGTCACLVGTIAKVRHCSYAEIPSLLPNSSRPAERWFLAIRPGDTPEKSSVAKLTLEWVDQWLDGVKAAFATA